MYCYIDVFWNYKMIRLGDMLDKGKKGYVFWRILVVGD